MDRVSSLDEDRILRSFIGVIDATLRTSYYQARRRRRAARTTSASSSIPRKVPDLPKPRPYREIFVYGPRVEGVHLRFGPVARGGLRWSDRREDFRTEVLGLVKAQMVKNTVIVPVGSKGGFFVKRPPAGGDRDAVLAEGVACYKLFINGLLDITDNLVDGKVVPPVDVVRHDQRRSVPGGRRRQGHGHVLRHRQRHRARARLLAGRCVRLRWLGRLRPQGHGHHRQGRVGVGQAPLPRDGPRQPDAGLHLRSASATCPATCSATACCCRRHIRLVAAFDHRHIFLDPNPDAARTFKERERMFKLPRSSWEDYDKSLISKGGGVYPRTRSRSRCRPRCARHSASRAASMR